MFMVKDELNNIKNLLNVRLKTQAKNFIGIFIVAAIMLTGSLVTTVLGILGNTDGFQHFNITDFSVTFFIGTVFGFLIVMFMYRQTNAKLSVFPQTNNTRFISSLLASYIIAAVASLIVLAMYLLTFGAIKLLSAFRDNIYFALNVDAGFIVVGFLVHLTYTFLAIAVIELAGTILRKWTYYAAVAFTALLSLIIINIVSVIEYAPRLLAFLIREPSFPLFFVKAIGIWLAITVAALIINRCTVYQKSQNKTATKSVVIICVVVVAIITFIVPVVIFRGVTSGSSYSVSELEPNRVDDYLPKSDEIRVDVSHLPRGSNINIKGTNLAIMSENGSVSYKSTDAVVIGADALNNLQGDTVVILFQHASYVVNGIEILQYANPRVTAHLEGDTLFIDYARDSANIVFMPIWGIVRQFDCFKDKGVFSAHSFGYSSGWYGSTNILISVE